MVRLESVGLRYDRPGDRGRDRSRDRATSATEVLQGLSFELPDGAFRWLLGPSGAGKTSLLRLLYLAVRPTSGRLSILDTEVTTARRAVLPRLRRRIGVVFQDFRLIPHLSALDTVAPLLRIAGRPRGADPRRRVGAAALGVGLAGRLDLPHRRRCLAANSSASPSPARLRRHRACCWPTSRPATSTSRRPSG